MKKILLLFLMITLYTKSKAIVCVSNGSGNWESSSTWSCTCLPACGDTIKILAGHTVTVTTINNTLSSGPPVYIKVYGVLNFQTGKKLSLSCWSRVSLMAGPPPGRLEGGGGGGASDQLNICNTLVWQASNGTQYGPKDFYVPGTLPVELVSFNVKQDGKYIHLNWCTATEINNSYFEILRSADGFEFNSIGQVIGSGTSNRKVNYEFSDNSPLKGSSYYRLKQVDYDGAFELHDVVSVQFSSNLSLVKVYPNPASTSLTLSDIDEEQIIIYIYDMLGKLIQQQQITLTSGTIDIGLNEIKRGSYFLKVETVDNRSLLNSYLTVSE